MLSISPVTLVGQFVILETLTHKHFAELIAAGSDSAIWTHSWPQNQAEPKSLERYFTRQLEQLQAQQFLPFTIRHKDTQQIIGNTTYNNFQISNHGLEIGGTWIIRAFQKTAANTESKYLMLKHAFEELNCVRVQFRVDPDNLNSIQAIERIGASYEGTLRNNYIVDGQIYDLSLYSIILEEWPRIKQHLETLLQKVYASGIEPSLS